MWISSLLAELFVVVVPQATRTYRVATDESRFEVEVGRAGLFKVFGHDHRIRVGAFTGTVEWKSEEPESSRFTSGDTRAFRREDERDGRARARHETMGCAANLGARRLGQDERKTRADLRDCRARRVMG